MIVCLWLYVCLCTVKTITISCQQLLKREREKLFCQTRPAGFDKKGNAKQQIGYKCYSYAFPPLPADFSSDLLGWRAPLSVFTWGNDVGSSNMGCAEVWTIFGYRYMVLNTSNNIPTTGSFKRLSCLLKLFISKGLATGKTFHFLHVSIMDHRRKECIRLKKDTIEVCFWNPSIDKKSFEEFFLPPLSGIRGTSLENYLQRSFRSLFQKQ